MGLTHSKLLIVKETILQINTYLVLGVEPGKAASPNFAGVVVCVCPRVSYLEGTWLLI